MDNIYLLVDQVSDRVSKQALSDRLVKERCEYYSNSAKLDSFSNEYAERLEDGLKYVRLGGYHIGSFLMGVITLPDCPDIIISVCTRKVDYSYFSNSEYKDSEKYLSEGTVYHPLDVEGHRKLFLSRIKDILLSPQAYHLEIPQKWYVVNSARDIKYKLDNGIIGRGNSLEWKVELKDR